jgi:hypothetical protein
MSLTQNALQGNIPTTNAAKGWLAGMVGPDGVGLKKEQDDFDQSSSVGRASKKGEPRWLLQ